MSIDGNLGVFESQGTDREADYTQGYSDWKDQPTASEKTLAAPYKIASWTTVRGRRPPWRT